MPDQTSQVAYRNRDYIFNVYLKNADGSAMSVVGSDWTFTLRSRHSNSSPLLTAGVGVNVLILNAAQGHIGINFPAASMNIAEGLAVAELVRTDNGYGTYGRWLVYVGDEDDLPEITRDIVSMAPENIIVQAFDSLLLGNLNPGGEIVNFQLTVQNFGSPVPAGAKFWVKVPFAGTIISHTTSSDINTTAVLDIWKDVGGAFPPTVADTITAAAKPSLTANRYAVDSFLAGWNKDFVAGDVFMLNVDSNDLATILQVELTVRKA